MQHWHALILLTSGLLTATAATAQQNQTQMAAAAIAPKAEDPQGWSGALAAGYARTSGNSDSSALNVKGNARYDLERWHHILGGTAIVTRIVAVMMLDMFESKIEFQARLKPASMAETRVLPERSSSLVRSKMRMLASTAIPTESTKAATPASVKVTGMNLKIANDTIV